MSALSSASTTRARLAGAEPRQRRATRRAAASRCRPSSPAASAAPPRRTASRRAASTQAGARRRCARRAGAHVPARNADGERACPRPRVLATATSPPCSRTSSCTSASPMPVPSCVRDARVLHAMEALEHAAAGRLRRMPTPVSLTRSSTRSPRARSATAISPSKVNLNALESRLRTIFSHMSRST